MSETKKSKEEGESTDMMQVETLDKIISVESVETNTVVGRGEGYRTATGFEHQNLMLMWGTPPQ